MEPAKPVSDGIIVKLEENKCPYTLSMSVESNSLVINVSEDDSVPSINYTLKLTLNDLVKESRYFKSFESSDELMPELKIYVMKIKLK